MGRAQSHRLISPAATQSESQDKAHLPSFSRGRIRVCLDHERPCLTIKIINIKRRLEDAVVECTSCVVTALGSILSVLKK